ncbi:MAG: nucleotidyltransferase domain-containing protein [Spirochaetales bacterium]|jgi:predicted nucleotidyltransferase|nr:nucleotidyltransferase domain-containing protein [Spirochaetales bacterium]
MTINNPQKEVQERVLPLIKECFENNLKSVILYGSAATGSFSSKYSDINLLILPEQNNYNSLMEFGKKGKKIIKKYRITTLVLSVDDFINSADVFPMEYHDIADRHITIFGDDIVEKLSITRTNIRHQLEERLRGLSNQIKQSIINSGGSRITLRANMRFIPVAVKTILRAALRLKGIKAEVLQGEMVFSEAEKVFGADLSGCLKLTGKDKEKDIFTLAAVLLTGIDKITSVIDSMDN